MGEFPSREHQIRPGEVRNPTGRNQYTRDDERRRAFRAIIEALDHFDDDEEKREELLRAMANAIVDGMLLAMGTRARPVDSRVLGYFINYLLGPPDVGYTPRMRANLRRGSRRRLKTATREDPEGLAARISDLLSSEGGR